MTTSRRPVIRVKADQKLYAVDGATGWELVRDGFAEWEYVPESKLDGLPELESASARAAFKRSTRKPRGK